MADRIEAREAPLAKIFSDDFLFTIPVYQRPFSWTVENFDALVEDIKNAMDNDLDQYFLGSIVLQQTDTISFDVVDGQQRLSALAILLAVIRDNTTNGDLQDKIRAWIYQAADKYKGLPDVMRITPWNELKALFKEYVYETGGTKRYLKDFLESKIKHKDQDDPRYHLFEAIFTFAAKTRNLADIERFVIYLVRNVYLVYIASNTQTSAFRLFNVLNSRGLPLQPIDLLKSENLGAIADEKIRETYAQKWRAVEDDLGREELSDVISFVRTIKVKEKLRLGIYEEFKQIFDKGLLVRGATFIDYLKSTVDIYRSRILEGDLESQKIDERNNYKVTADLMLRFVPFSDWIPTMLAFCDRWSADKKPLRFLLKLEKKVILEWVMGYSPTERITSLNNVLKAIEKSKSADEAIDLMELPDKKRAEKALLDILADREFYWLYGKKLAKYLLLRIDKEMWELENFPGYPGTVTVEHVLPQTPADKSTWLKIFSSDERAELTDKLGNLLLLSRRKNSEAQNYDFAKKKRVYFNTKATPFKITQKIDDYQDWTPDAVRTRQNDLVEICKKIFLNP